MAGINQGLAAAGLSPDLTDSVINAATKHREHRAREQVSYL